MSNKKIRKVISHENLPARSPFVATILLLLMLENTDYPQWIYGAYGSVLVIAWVSWIYRVLRQEQVEVNLDED